MKNPLKILFFIPSMRMGGAERVASLLCNDWSEKGHQVILATFDTPENDFFKVHNTVKRDSLGLYYSNKTNFLKIIRDNMVRLWRLRRSIQKCNPDVVVSFMDVPNILALMACFGTNIPVVISERTYPPFFPRSAIHTFLRRFLYKFSFKLVCQTHDVASWASLFLSPDKIEVIPNPLQKKQSQKEKTSLNNCVEHKKILAAGRLSTQKGFDLLIQACRKVFQKHPDWSLNIAGDGEEKANLHKFIMDYKLEANIKLIGAHHNLADLFNTSDIFVLSSRVEGFPNILLEAMDHKMAVVSFDCKCGPKDIITHKKTGLLVEDGDVNALGDALCDLIENSPMRKEMGDASLDAIQHYELDLISERWLLLLKNCPKRA